MGYALTVQLPDEAAFRHLERTAEALGMSLSELGEAALQIAGLSADPEDQLERLADRLESYGEADLERDVQEFARAEVSYPDPLQSRKAETQDPYGIGALFARPLERR